MNYSRRPRRYLTRTHAGLTSNHPDGYVRPVQPEVLAALVAAFASVLGAIVVSVLTYRENEKSRRIQERLTESQVRAQAELEKLKRQLDTEARIEQRLATARVDLDQYRVPLLDTAYNLGQRIHNIQRRAFFSYLQSPDRRTSAIRSTQFRFAEFFAWVEIRRMNANRLDLESQGESTPTDELVSTISGLLSSDASGQDLMLWREEQRGIGELMIQESRGSWRSAGFGTFLLKYDSVFAPLMDRFGVELEEHAETSQRLNAVQQALAELVVSIDRYHAYTGGHDGTTAGWLKDSLNGGAFRKSG